MEDTMINNKEAFEEQLKECKVLTEENISFLKGRGLYGDYEVGDKILSVFIETVVDVDNVEVRMKTFVERNFDKFLNEYEFLRSSTSIPVFKKPPTKDELAKELKEKLLAKF